MTTFCPIYHYLVFTINRRETGYDGHDVSFLALDSFGGVLGSAFAALENDALRLGPNNSSEVISFRNYPIIPWRR